MNYNKGKVNYLDRERNVETYPIEDSGIDSATITADARGEISIRSGNGYSSEKLESLKRKWTESDETVTVEGK